MLALLWLSFSTSTSVFSFKPTIMSFQATIDLARVSVTSLRTFWFCFYLVSSVIFARDFCIVSISSSNTVLRSSSMTTDLSACGIIVLDARGDIWRFGGDACRLGGDCCLGGNICRADFCASFTGEAGTGFSAIFSG